MHAAALAIVTSSGACQIMRLSLKPLHNPSLPMPVFLSLSLFLKCDGPPFQPLQAEEVLGCATCVERREIMFWFS